MTRKGKIVVNKYNIEITETIQKTIEVEADNEQAALHIAMKKYKNSEVILTDEDFIDVDFKSV